MQHAAQCRTHVATTIGGAFGKARAASSKAATSSATPSSRAMRSAWRRNLAVARGSFSVKKPPGPMRRLYVSAFARTFEFGWMGKRPEWMCLARGGNINDAPTNMR